MTDKMFINDNGHKFSLAIENLRPDTGYSYKVDTPVTEELYNTVDWHTGVDESNETAITTRVNPYPELTWSAINAEMQRLQAEYDAQEYARKRKAEYPQFEELVVALYDEEDKAAIEVKRAAVKLKYPK
jgi:hypothetical protein